MMRAEAVMLDGRQQVAVRARDLHEAMAVVTSFRVWFDRLVVRHVLKEGADFEHRGAEGGRAGRRDAVLSIEAAGRIAQAKGLRSIVDDVELPSARDGGGPEASEGGWTMPAVTTVATPDGMAATVDLEDLHASLGVATKYTDWRRRRIEEYGLQEGRDFRANVRKPLRGGTNARTDVTITVAKELAMGERNAIGRALRRYFIRCEERLRAENARAAAEENARLQAELSAAKAVAGPAAPDGAAVPPGPDPTRPERASAVAEAVRLPGMTAELLARVLDALDEAGTADGPAMRTSGARTAPQHGAVAATPSHLFRTSVGVLIDLSLSGKAASTADRRAALRHAGCRDVDRRTFTFWRQAYEGRERPEGARPQRGEDVVDGMTLEMRREAVRAFLAVTAERPTARQRWLDAVKAAKAQAIIEASWAKVDGKMH